MTSRSIAIAIIGVAIVAAVIFVALTQAGRPVADAPLIPSPTTTADAPSAGPSPGASPTSGSEVPPAQRPPATATPPAADEQGPHAETPPRSTPGTALPPRDAPAPLLTGPMPAPASSKGALVAGYPKRIAGPLSGSDIVSSSIATEDDVMQLTLVASSTATLDDVRAHYRKLWSSLGLREHTAADGTLTFAGGFESLSLSITSSATGNRYSIFGVFRTS